MRSSRGMVLKSTWPGGTVGRLFYSR